MFIKLTGHRWNNTIRINVEKIDTYEFTGSVEYTSITVSGVEYAVKETPEEIDEMVKKCLGS